MTIFLSCMWHTKKAAPYWLPFLPLFNVESETVFIKITHNFDEKLVYMSR